MFCKKHNKLEKLETQETSQSEFVNDVYFALFVLHTNYNLRESDFLVFHIWKVYSIAQRISNITVQNKL